MLQTNESFLGMILQGGFTMWPLFACSLVGVFVIVERTLFFKRISKVMETFHLEVMNALLRQDRSQILELLRREAELPTAQLLKTAMDRLTSSDSVIKEHWREAVERRRALVNQDLRKFLWVLGTIASAAPFIGLAGTVVGILGAFGEMAKKGAGGFTVVAAGISEALIATAAGIVVAVVAVMAFNAFQAHVTKAVLLVRIQTDEMCEQLSKRIQGLGDFDTQKSGQGLT